MSFTEKNKNFIQMRFHSETRGMSIAERKNHYNINLRKETLERVKSYFHNFRKDLKINYDLNAPLNLFSTHSININEEINDYSEILILIKDYDFEILIMSLFFENQSNILIGKLSKKIIEFTPIGFNDKYELLDLIKNFKSLDEFLIEKLFSIIGVTNYEIKEESQNRNEIIKKLGSWLKIKFVTEDSEKEITKILFYFCIYWNIKFSKTIEETKRMIFLQTITKCIEESNYSLKVSFNKIIQQLKTDLDCIFPEIKHPPFLETVDLAIKRGSLNSKYQNDVTKFQKILIDSDNYLFKIDSFSFIELLEKFFVSDLLLQEIISKKIKQNFAEGKHLSIDEIITFKSILNDQNYVKNDSNAKLINHIIRSNYLFDMIENIGLTESIKQKINFKKEDLKEAVVSYSNIELKEFGIHIGKKIIEATNQLTKLKLEEKTEKDILIRQRKYIEKLEEALTRVKNKTYGICRVTGKLIAKERLFAVPHSTLSAEAQRMNYKNNLNGNT